MKKVLTTIGQVIGGALLTLIVLALLFNAVLQQSYRNAPPTEQEISENPELVNYLD